MLVREPLDIRGSRAPVAAFRASETLAEQQAAATAMAAAHAQQPQPRRHALRMRTNADGFGRHAALLRARQGVDSSSSRVLWHPPPSLPRCEFGTCHATTTGRLFNATGNCTS